MQKVLSRDIWQNVEEHMKFVQWEVVEQLQNVRRCAVEHIVYVHFYEVERFVYVPC